MIYIIDPASGHVMFAEIYIFSIDDSECRRIAAFRYIDKLSWKKVAEQMGSGHTEDSCRKTLERYMKKK